MGKGSQPKHARKAKMSVQRDAMPQEHVPFDASTASANGASTTTATANPPATTANPPAATANSTEGTTISPEAQDIVNRLNMVDKKITQLRTARTADPDTALDKLLTMAIPSLAGMIAGRVFNTIWTAGFGAPNATRRNKGGQRSKAGKKGATGMAKLSDDLQAPGKTNTGNSLMKDLLFTACSAAFVAVIAQISDKSVRSMITALQRRRK